MIFLFFLLTTARREFLTRIVKEGRKKSSERIRVGQESHCKDSLCHGTTVLRNNSSLMSFSFDYTSLWCEEHFLRDKPCRARLTETLLSLFPFAQRESFHEKKVPQTTFFEKKKLFLKEERRVSEGKCERDMSTSWTLVLPSRKACFKARGDLGILKTQEEDSSQKKADWPPVEVVFLSPSFILNMM